MPKKFQILMVDDDEDAVELVRVVFPKSSGFQIKSLPHPNGLIPALRKRSYNLVILDLAFPGADGREFLPKLRADPELAAVPVIVLTAHGSARLPSECLNLGADDFILKPWRADELSARVQAILRRRGSAIDASGVLRCGKAAFDGRRGRLTIDRAVVPLTPTEARIFQVLISNKDRNVSRRELLRGVWAIDVPGFESIRTRRLDTHIQNIRTKLGSAAGIIRTVSHFGYAFDEAAAARL